VNANDTSRKGTRCIIQSIKSSQEFIPETHRRALQDAKREYKKGQEKAHDETLPMISLQLAPQQQRAVQVISRHKVSAWLTAPPVKRHHFDLSANEFRDALALRYRRPLCRTPTTCDGCGEPFSMTHALDCKKGGLIIQRHNEIRDTIGDLASIAWKNIIKEPVVRDANPQHGQPALVADLGARGVWERQTEALFDIRVVDTDAPSYGSRPVESILSSAETIKKHKYLEAALERRATFTPVVISVDGIFGREGEMFVKKLSEDIAAKWDRPESQVTEWVRTRLSFAVVRAVHLCIRGSRKKWRSLGVVDGASLATTLPGTT